MNYTVNLLWIFISLLIVSHFFCVLQTIQHITVKDILDDNIFYRVTFNKRLGISNFD